MQELLEKAGFTLREQTETSTRYVNSHTGDRILIFPDGKISLLGFTGPALELTREELESLLKGN